ncbi:hypothetical protein MGYG_08275 [Nannizzia gypsea CBS 118893]|uniref:LysM domain-containing protein n=1 Tax=Arthroderma gypseum (strain ATCC MYA-4604 / CBS 118893) TaxID=535722 RepID=E4V681_ARTGP|nr:hypothetical protein MGYG_08275 [Nannizzia gypsea CBS 118893]EFR05264.1 hypothetical protein MGYG_08275 [Nannizzia gypsea CBS 118893]
MSNDTNLLDASNSWTSISAHGNGSGSAASTVRSRTRRVIPSYDGTDDDGQIADFPGNTPQRSTRSLHTNGGTSTSSPYSSRGVSPIPSKRLPRTGGGGASLHGSQSQSTLRGRGVGFGGMIREDTRGSGKSNGFASDFLESPWSSLQGLASNIIGSGSALINGEPGKPLGPRSRSVGGNLARNRQTGPTSWGPPRSIIGEANPDAQRERQELVQAKRREALLQTNGDSFPDIMGNYKRRDSGDGFERSTGTSTPAQEEGDALVYIHLVQSNDTLTGVSIRYGCALAVLRKSNGFWPSDSIQSRKTIVLPVESCTLKGLPIPEEEVRKQGDDPTEDDPDHDTSSLVPDTHASTSCDFRYGGSQSDRDKVENESTSDSPWTHHSWVKLDGFSSPVEIGRLPRRSLGFFPRARRKSQLRLSPYKDNPRLSSSAHDLSDLHSTPSRKQWDSTSSPRVSDVSRDSSIAGTRPPRYSTSLQHKRQRSITLSGPGGVGTLENARCPGPPIDKFTTFVNSHLPTLTIKPAPNDTAPTFASLQNLDRISLDSADSAVFSSSSTGGLENVGGAIEGWFRKVATRAKAGINEIQHQQQPLSQRLANLGLAGTSGDLIELNDASEPARASPSPSPDFMGGSNGTKATSNSLSDTPAVRRNAFNNDASSYVDHRQKKTD